MTVVLRVREPGYGYRPGTRVPPAGQPGAPVALSDQRSETGITGIRAPGAGRGCWCTGSLIVPKCGCLKSNIVIRLPMAGLTFGMYTPGVAFGRLSSL